MLLPFFDKIKRFISENPSKVTHPHCHNKLLLHS